MQRMNIYIGDKPGIKDRLKKVADKKDVSISWVVKRAVEEYLNNEEV